MGKIVSRPTANAARAKAARLSDKTPAGLGFRMPAEWEPHEATWIGWPHQLTDWPGKFGPIPWVYAEIARKICAGEILRVLVNSKQHEAQARRVLARVGVDLGRIEFFRFPTNRGWTRDSGPIFIRRDDGELAIIRFRFNGWARYNDWRRDDAVPRLAPRWLAALHLGPRARAEHGDSGNVVDFRAVEEKIRELGEEFEADPERLDEVERRDLLLDRR